MKPDCPVKRHWHTSNHPVFCNPRLSSPTSAVLGSEAALVILQERRRLDAINGSDTTSCETPFVVLEQGRGLNAINCGHSTACEAPFMVLKQGWSLYAINRSDTT